MNWDLKFLTALPNPIKILSSPTESQRSIQSTFCESNIARNQRILLLLYFNNWLHILSI